MTQLTQFAEPQGREAVLEIELGAEDLRKLSQARPGRQPATVPALAAEVPPPKRQGLSRIQIGVGAASLVAVLIGFAVDRSPGTPQSAHPAPLAPPPVAMVAAAPATAVADAVPVIFRNPFDRSEVFEFPAGTSQAEARARVADLLLERAQERRAQYKSTATHHTRVASR